MILCHVSSSVVSRRGRQPKATRCGPPRGRHSVWQGVKALPPLSLSLSQWLTSSTFGVLDFRLVIQYNAGVDQRIPTLASDACLADKVWTLLVRVALDRVHRSLGSAAAEFELAPAQAMALGELQIDQPLPMRELATRLKCDPSNITGLIDRLEARGLVERQPHPADRRVKYLVLTAAGRELRERLSARIFAAPSCVATLGERDQQKLHDLLLRVLTE